MDILKQETVQEQQSSTPEEGVFLNLLRSSDALNRAFQRSTRRFGITATQYNVLRILRGAHPDGLNCAAIGRRMITAEPDITRLLNRLKMLRLVRQHRDRQDRRVVWTQISEAGLEVLRSMEPVIAQLPAELLGHMNPGELAALNSLLELARARSAAAENRTEVFDQQRMPTEVLNLSDADKAAAESPQPIAQ